MKYFFFLLFVIFFFCTIQTFVFAAENVSTSVETYYTVDDTGMTKVLEKISMTNTGQYTFPSSYSLTIGINDVHSIRAYDSNGSLRYSISHQKSRDQLHNNTTIVVDLASANAGIGRINRFDISFTADSLAKKIGNNWQISIPGISNPDMFSNYTVSVSAPKSFGTASIIKPEIPGGNQSGSSFFFSKKQIGKSGILITFGTFQKYQFSLVYPLKNSSSEEMQTEIALPPDTAYQQVLLNAISPKPRKIYADQDGNWLAVFSLSPREQKKVLVRITVVVLANPKTQSISEEQRRDLLKSQKYWETENKDIKKLAANLKTPDRIYQYVVNTLSYNYDKSSGYKQRLGAEEALSNPTLAVCFEFSDLFVALSRAAGIPARELEGYAYTNDSAKTPVLNTSDVLHAWPEYYDTGKKTWMMIDPTWGNTTGGLDYFHSFDMNHVTFAIHGLDSEYPIPAGEYTGGNTKTKNIQVSFSQKKIIEQANSISLHHSFKRWYIAGLPIQGTVTIKNNGNTGIEGKILEVQLDPSSKPMKYAVNMIPPFGSQDVTISLGRASILTNKSYTITILFDGKKYTQTTTVGSISMRVFFAVGGFIGVAAIALLTFAFKARRLPFQR